MNIIEKLGTSEEIKQYNMYQFPGEMIEEPNEEYVTYDDYLKLEKQRDELLEALIKSVDHGLTYTKTRKRLDEVIHDIKLVTNIAQKPWEEIKELLNE